MTDLQDSQLASELRGASGSVQVQVLGDFAPSVVHRLRRRKTLRLAAGGAAAIVAAGGGLGFSSTTGPTTRVIASSPTAWTTSTTARGGSSAAASVPTVTVPGYAPASAEAVVTRCSSTGSGIVLPGATLRGAFSDASGRAFVLASATGWAECEISPQGQVTAEPGESFAAAEGWGSPAISNLLGNPSDPVGVQQEHPLPDTLAAWIMTPVESDSVVSESVLPGTRITAEGRAGRGIARVVVTFDNGALISSPVENGFYLARSTSSAVSVGFAMGIRNISGYDTSGHLVYRLSETKGFSGGLLHCYVTSTGLPLTPGFPGASCLRATPWP